jgi:crotonobetaine/carnitine-CoA ligase
VAKGTAYTLAADAPRTIPEWIRYRAGVGGDKLALDIDGTTRSYAEVDRETDRAAAGLAALGLAEGEHVAVMMQNSVENVATWFGIHKAGLVEVPVHTASRGAALEYIVDHADVQAIVLDELYLPHLASIADGLPKLRHVVVNRKEAGEGAAELPSRLAVHDLEAILGSDGPTPTPQLRIGDRAMILHSSGTTGPPKGVELSQEACLNATRHLAWLMDYTEADTLYTAFPLFHNNAKFTTVMAALEAGGSVVMSKRFSVSGFWDLTREKGITAFNYMGALLMMLYKQPERDDDADNPVRIAFGAPTPIEMWEQFERRFDMKLVQPYGMTEGPMMCENRLDDRKLGTSGKESMSYQVRIVDENDEEVPRNTPGEIVVRPKRAFAIFSGYYRRPEDTVDAWRNLWFHTGDRGRMDDEGFVTFLDRMKDSIRRRGENISAWEVESTINTHPAVLEATAYGVTSDLSEADVMVAVQLKPGASLEPAELLDYCTGKMAHFAMPRYVRFMDALPKNASDRVEKFKLREEAVTPDTWDREDAGYKVQR